MILSKPNHIRIYGHRGARGDLPENTLESFEYIFKNNITGLELDILFSKDLIPVITHDFFLDPDQTKDLDGNWIASNSISIIGKTYKELQNYDVGGVNKLSRYGRRFLNQKTLENQRIPNLNQLFSLLQKYNKENLIINLEFKSTPLDSQLVPQPNQIVNLVKKDIKESDLMEQILISSFDWRILKEFRTQMPNLARAYLSTQENLKKTKKNVYKNSPWMDIFPYPNNLELPKIIKNLGGKAWHVWRKDITKKNVEIAHEENLAVNVWTVNKEDEILKMIDFGVDGIMTDYPLKLKEFCEKKNINWF